MTELMKRYWNETGKDAITFSNMATHFTDDYVAWLELQNLLLKLQLTWRQVSEKPKEGQIVFVLIQTGWVVAQYLHGEFYIDDGFTFGDKISGVTHWLPIPPAPEGE